jgi:hypothetical protein
LQLLQDQCSSLEGSSVPISFEDFKGGYAIFTFNLNPDSDSCSAHKSKPVGGVIKILADFKDKTTSPLMFLFIMETDRTIEIDRDYNVTVA